MRRSPIHVIGAACRVPGASSPGELWRLLKAQRSVVGPPPADRAWFNNLLHSRQNEAGYSYSFQGGYLAEPYGFDPTPFGISPREALQIDPQQRQLMEVVWEALEDAGVAPGDWAGGEVGVYVGASSLDYGNLHMADLASVDRHFMTGNTLSIIANRISYAFDWRGPSFTIDTACSSSLVALSQAFEALQSGQVSTAVVCGVNLLLSPASFVGFSRASMLSATGLCRPFSAKADGYVRSEGAIAIVLATEEAFANAGARSRATLIAAGSNSDGRTNGISLPSFEAQKRLLERIYSRAEIAPEDLSFVEAHGTGTRVGDPAEAEAIGQALGRHRSAPLPIGSIKSNIGHLEPASGLAGVLKSLLALEAGMLPASLHAEELNPHIDLEGLNLLLARDAIALQPRAGAMMAGVSSFGFGGSNAHVVLRRAMRDNPASVSEVAPPPMITLSAATSDALRAQAAQAAAAILATDTPIGGFASAMAHHRAKLSETLTLPLDTAESVGAALSAFASGQAPKAMIHGRAVADGASVAFVYSGNGSQLAGAGRSAFDANAMFRQRFEEIDALFGSLSGWSLVDAMRDDGPEERFAATSMAQPVIFAIQAAATLALRQLGLRPICVLGHSVGEVAAAQAAGILTLADAVRVIYHRSELQEQARGLGRMAVIALGEEAAAQMLSELALPGVGIAAVNNARNVTVSGSGPAVAALLRHARKQRVVARPLDLDYPFHSPLLAPIQVPLERALADLTPRQGEVAFLSGVTPGPVDGTALDGRYWWRNVAEPVRFYEAMQAALAAGAQVFVEIGPRPLLKGTVADIIRERGHRGEALATFDAADAAADHDPIRAVAARAYVHGASVDKDQLFGPAPAGRVALPTYPWRRQRFEHAPSPAALNVFARARSHPLLGARLSVDALEWRNELDAVRRPLLADHVVDGETVAPAAALAEMALAAARQVWPTGAIALQEFDILQPLVLSADALRSTITTLDMSARRVEVKSRARHSEGDWIVHARGDIGPSATAPAFTAPAQTLDGSAGTEEIYAAAASSRLHYGPSFRLANAMRFGVDVIEVDLSPALQAGSEDQPFVLRPASLDAAFHALLFRMSGRAGQTRAYLPVRFQALTVFKDDASVAKAVLVREKEREHTLTASLALLDPQGDVVAVLRSALFRAVVFDRADQVSADVHSTIIALAPTRAGERHRALLDALQRAAARPCRADDACLLLDAFARAAAYEALERLLDQGSIDLVASVGRGVLAQDMLPAAERLLHLLARAGCATHDGAAWRLVEGALPSSLRLLRTIAADYPEAAAELAACASLPARLARMLAPKGPPIQRGGLGLASARSLLLRPAGERLAAALRDHADAQGRPLSLLLVEQGSDALLPDLLPLLNDRTLRITLGCADDDVVERVRAKHRAIAGINAIDLSRSAKGDDWFDLAVLSQFAGAGSAAALPPGLARRLRAGAHVLALRPSSPDLLDCLAASSGEPGRVSAGRLSAAEAQQSLSTSDFVPGPVIAGEGEGEFIVLTRSDEQPRHGARAIRLLDGAPVAIASEISAVGRARGITVNNADDDARLVLFENSPSPTKGEPANPSASREVRQRTSRIGRLLEDLRGSGRGADVWIVFSGGLDPNATVEPVEAAVWAYCRVAINEYPDLDLRLLALDRGLSSTMAASLLLDALDLQGEEREYFASAQGVAGVRHLRGPDPAWVADPQSGTTLKLPARGLLSQLHWASTPRRTPGAGEIEVAVAATGLNFRDVMLATGFLDDDVLDAGLAGAVLGLECAGTVVQVGEGVTQFRIGDRVMGFAGESFASHVIGRADLFASAPDAWRLEAAATVPVAFLTAWYALVESARLRRGEWVLIHGGAGGVGLAALQIAKHLGAHVAITAGTPEKRALAGLYGADKVYDSRSLTFADDLRADIGAVDVVLNSLAGDAMLASLQILSPFGRFVELGKRDYVANTQVGLRVFRRNISYFGVDLDQLLVDRPDLARSMMAEVAGALASGAFSGLPYQVFEPQEVESAFRLMQSSGHVGKIVLRPALQPDRASLDSIPYRTGPGVHVVVGGTAGFGQATARWLASAGAKRLVLASRTGDVVGPAADELARIRDAGVEVRVEALDVTQRHSVMEFLARIRAEWGPLAGVIHAGAVIEDGLIAHADAARTTRVLEPKVEGAINLDTATRGDRLDYFVVFSSAANHFGSPGQSDYAAANAFMEALVQNRRQQGLPGLAVAWGAIGDAGVLTRSPELAERLERLTGIAAMPAAHALAHLGGAMARERSGASAPTLICSPVSGAAGMELPLLASAAFSEMPKSQALSGRTGAEALRFEELAALADSAVLENALTEALSGEIAEILRMPAGAIEVDRPLSELGLDSLMGLELRLAVERRLGLDLPLFAITAATSLSEIVKRLAMDIRAGHHDEAETPPAVAEDLALMQRHSADHQAVVATAAQLDIVDATRQSIRRLL